MLRNTVQYGFFFQYSCDVCPKKKAFHPSHGFGVVGYFTTQFSKSESKAVSEKSSLFTMLLSTNGTSRFIAGMISLFVGGSRLKEKS
jgi:hypothetical protein